MDLFLMGLADSYPIVFKVAMYLGMARMIMKPLMVFLQDVVKVYPGEKDDIMLEKIMGNKIYKGLVFVLDYALSLKLPKPVKKL